MEPIKSILARANRLPKRGESEMLEENHLGEITGTCPICRGAGVVHPLGENGQPQYNQVVPCECSRERVLRERYEHMLKYCQLPAGIANWTFESFDASGPLQEAYDLALQLAEERGGIKWLVMVGSVDVGKTHLAVAICRRWLARGKPARYVLVPQMLDELRWSYDREGGYEQMMKFMLGVPLLVLDDLGTQRPTEWGGEKLMQIIDHRYVNEMPLVITTNRSLDALPGDVECRIGSRILRAEFAMVVSIDAPEYRLRRAK